MQQQLQRKRSYSLPSQNRTYIKLLFKQALGLVREEPNLASNLQEKMESKMKEIAAAHSCLSDPDKWVVMNTRIIFFFPFPMFCKSKSLSTFRREEYDRKLDRMLRREETDLDVSQPNFLFAFALLLLLAPAIINHISVCLIITTLAFVFKLNFS